MYLVLQLQFLQVNLQIIYVNEELKYKKHNISIISCICNFFFHMSLSSHYKIIYFFIQSFSNNGNRNVKWVLDSRALRAEYRSQYELNFFFFTCLEHGLKRWIHVGMGLLTGPTLFLENFFYDIIITNML